MSETGMFGPCADGNFVEFFTKDKKLDVESQKQGRPIFVTEDWVKIGSPGDLKTRPEFQMTEIYCNRYEKEYTTWKKRLEGGDSNGVIGTPLLEWPQIDRSLAVGLRAQGILNVEMLAAIQDSNLHNFGPGMRAKRDQAKAFLEAARGHAPIARLTEENRQLRDQLTALQQQMAEVAAAVKERADDPNAVIGPIGASPAPSDIQAMINAAVAAAVGGSNGKRRRGRPRKDHAAKPAEQPSA